MTTTLEAPAARWERPALACLLLGTAGLYLVNLSANGFGNAFYAAAVQAGTRSWTAFLFGSLDPSNFITVDKPPASLWVMALSARVFGFSSWSVLVPEALMGVAAVALLYAAVRRAAGPGAGLIAGVVLAVTPTVLLVFRYDNPDALLLLLVVAAGYCVVRALEHGRTRWVLAAGTLLGFAFLTKMLEAFLVAPGLLLAYAWAAPVRVRTWVWQVLAAGAAVLVSAGWWLVLELLWPVADRPWIGGSTDDSSVQLALGYNGFSRLLGRGAGGFGGGRPPGDVPEAVRRVAAGFGRGGAGGGFGGRSGIGRLFETSLGGQVAWLLPAALVLLAAGLWITRRAVRTDPVRASLLLWGGATIGAGAVLSFMQGTFHPYYSSQIAPGIAALTGIGTVLLWRARASAWVRVTAAVTLAGSAVWAFVLLDRTPEFLPWLRWVVLAAGVPAALALLGPVRRGPVRGGIVAAGVAAVALLAGPAAYAAQTDATVHTGGGVTAGPASGPRGGFGRDAAPSPALAGLLGSAGTEWSAATLGSQGAASLELAGAGPVMAIGGFTGSDPVPTLAQFRADVAAGKVHWFVSRPGGGRAGRGGGTGAAIASWVGQHFAPEQVGGATVYDLLPGPGPVTAAPASG